MLFAGLTDAGRSDVQQRRVMGGFPNLGVLFWGVPTMRSALVSPYLGTLLYLYVGVIAGGVQFGLLTSRTRFCYTLEL